MQVDRWVSRDEDGELKLWNNEPDFMNEDGEYAQDVNGEKPRLEVAAEDVSGNEILGHLGLATITSYLNTGEAIEVSVLLDGDTYTGPQQ
jgi:hypothetical protein